MSDDRWFIATWRRDASTNTWILVNRTYRGPYKTTREAQSISGLLESFNNPNEAHIPYHEGDPIPPPAAGPAAYTIPTDPTQLVADLRDKLYPVIDRLYVRLLVSHQHNDAIEERALRVMIDQTQSALRLAEQGLGIPPPTQEMMT